MMTRIGAAAIIGILLLAEPAAQRGKITGTVEAGGRPVSNATVSLDDAALGVLTTRTDSKGRFEFSEGSGGIVTVTSREYVTAKRVWPPRSGSTLQFSLKQPSVVDGVLMDMATRRGVVGRVNLLTQSRYHHVTKSARTRDGSFSFVGVPPGTAVVQAYAHGFAPYFGTLSVSEGERTTNNIGLKLEAVALGTVVSGDAAVAGATVRVTYSSSLTGAEVLQNLAGGILVTGADGRFSVRGLVPDTAATLQAELDGRFSDTATVTIEPGMQRTGIVLRMQ